MSQVRNSFQMLFDLMCRYRRYLKWGVLALAVALGLMILAPFGHYFAADLEYGFLRDKNDFFFNSGYYLAFYAHIVAAPLAFFIGTLQVSRTIRVRRPLLHRFAGRAYCGCVLVAAAPGGLVMGWRAYGGLPSALCFTLLAALTWMTTLVGWHYGRRGDARRHSKWMIRSYLLISSAICLRVLHPLLAAMGLGHELTYQIAVWSSWLLPLGMFEIGTRLRRNCRHPYPQAQPARD